MTLVWPVISSMSIEFHFAKLSTENYTGLGILLELCCRSRESKINNGAKRNIGPTK